MKKIYFFISAAIILAAAAAICLLKKDSKMNSLNTTDPELAALWNNFMNADVLPHGSLEVKTRALVLFAGHVAAGSVNEYKMFLAQALDNGVSPVEAKEAIYQTIPYAGMAKAYDFLIATNEVLQSRGIRLPLAGQSTTSPQTRLKKGIAVQGDIFGAENIRAMRESAPAELKHIQDYLSANCFGDYYTRNGLDIKTRELLTFAVLVSMGGAEPQARAHVQANLNVGNSRENLIDTVTQLLPFIGYPRSLNAINVINEVTKKD